MNAENNKIEQARKLLVQLALGEICSEDEFSDFYRQIRCGILHQAETKGGWTIRREGPLLRKETKIINATEFLNRLKEYLMWYREELSKRDFKQDGLWKNFRLKMKAIKENCKPLPKPASDT